VLPGAITLSWIILSGKAQEKRGWGRKRWRKCVLRVESSTNLWRVEKTLFAHQNQVLRGEEKHSLLRSFLFMFVPMMCKHEQGWFWHLMLSYLIMSMCSFLMLAHCGTFRNWSEIGGGPSKSWASGELHCGKHMPKANQSVSSLLAGWWGTGEPSWLPKQASLRAQYAVKGKLNSSG
jgi:hypothetical protein